MDSHSLESAIGPERSDLSRSAGTWYPLAMESPSFAGESPGLDQMMSDRDRRRHLDSIDLLSRDQLARDAALDPAHFGEIVTRWREVSPEQLGDVILLRVRGQPCHVGVVVARGKFLHSLEGTQSCVERYENLKWHRRTLGFYRYAG